LQNKAIKSGESQRSICFILILKRQAQAGLYRPGCRYDL